MTELLINKQRVVLPQEFSFEVIRENPFFTKNGTFTLDVTLSLLNKANARIFKHIHRFNVDKKTEELTAFLKVDNIVFINGTAIVDEITNEEITLQLLSGNSELNFVIGGDKKLNELPLGNAPEITPYTIDAYVRKTYPEVEWQFVPIYSENEDCRFNDIEQDNLVFYIADMEKTIIQPFLCTIIFNVFKSLGYNITRNDIESSKYNTLFCVNGVITSEYAKMLPDWTVTDFLSEIENLFNSILFLDAYTKNVEILFRGNYFENCKIIAIEDVLDEYSIKVDKDKQFFNKNTNIAYDIPSEDDYFKYQRLNDDVKNVITEYVIKENRHDVKAQFDSDFPDFSKRKIYKNKETDTEYIQAYINTGYGLRKVEILKDLLNNPDTSDKIVLKIIPAPLHLAARDGTSGPPITQTYSPFRDENDDTMSIFDILENGLSKEETNTQLKLAFFDGPRPIGRVPYPQAYIDYIDDSFSIVDDEYTNNEGKTLRLAGKHGLNELYESGIEVDGKNEYVITFLFKGSDIDVRSIFMIKNKRFACKELRYEITQNGISKQIQGTFYEMKN